MIRFILTFLCITLLAQGCASSGYMRMSETIIVDDGSTAITHVREAEMKSGSSEKAPTLELPESTYTPSVIGSTVTETNNGSSTVKITEPKVGYTISSKGIDAVGSAIGGMTIVSNLFKWPMVIGFLMIASGIILLFVPIPVLGGQLKKASIGVILGGLSIVVISYFLTAYGWMIALFGGILAIMAILYLIFKLRSTSIALTDTVKTAEDIKTVLTPEQKDEVFDSPHSIARENQSDITKKLVRKTREDLGFK